MKSRKKQLLANAVVFLLLFFVSIYRQLSLRYLPDDPFRTYILYGSYVILLTAWGVSIWSRVAQRDMIRFLLAEDIIMFIGLTIRFVQDTFLEDNIPALRMTGLFLATMLLPMITLGLFASLCIGEGDGYRVPKKWYLFLLPSIILLPLILTDNYHHFFTFIITEEPQPNLTYHPYIGFYLTFALVLVAASIRVYQIYKRNNLMDSRPFLRRIVPFAEPILLVIFYLPYIINWLRVDAPLAPVEVIEQYAKIYYIEAVTWELFIYLGLVPVNTDYRAVFEQSTLGMQILCEDGERIRSLNAIEISEEALNKLRKEPCIIEQADKELHIHHIDGADVIWNKDVSRLRNTIKELNKSAEELAQEGVLLGEELRAKNDEASLSAKNQIYDSLTREVQAQMDLVKTICNDQPQREDTKSDLWKLVLLGTYIKRRCNLRLIEQENGKITNMDLRISFEDMVSAIQLKGIKAALQWSSEHEYSPGLGIAAFDMLEKLLESTQFTADSLDVCAADRSIIISVYGTDRLPQIDMTAFGDVDVSWKTTDDGLQMIMRKAGD